MRKAKFKEYLADLKAFFSECFLGLRAVFKRGQRHGLKYYVFLFRWFLIGKYHCEFKHTCTKKVFFIINRLLWAFIIFSCTMTSAVLVKAAFL